MSSAPVSLRLQRDELRELFAVVARYRWRLGAEVLLRFILRGLIVGAALVVVVSVVDWWFEAGVQSIWLWSALLLPAVGALGLALAFWPSERQAARTADHRLGTRRTGRHRRRAWPHRERWAVRSTPAPGHHRARRERAAPLAIRPGEPQARACVRGWAGPARGVVAAAAVRPEAALRHSGGDASGDVRWPKRSTACRSTLADIPGLDAVSIDAQSVESDLAPRVRQAQAEQEALDRLAQALGQVSAAQNAADAIQRGDFGEARQQLSTLGEESDQLSDAAKKQLAQALQQAASATGADKPLADRERQAAVALSRSNYSDQRNALRQLGEQVERSGARSVPAAQLARDAGRLQQQQANSGGQQGAAGQAPAASSIQAQPGAGMMNGAQGGQAQTGTEAGEQGGVGAGTGTTDGVGDPAGRLSTAGQLVEVPTKLGSGPGQRPPDGTEDQVGTNPGMASRSVSEAAQTQQTGQVTPEQNLVPGDQRPVVRGYFR